MKLEEYIIKKECSSDWQLNDRLKKVQEIIESEALFNEVVKEQVRIYREHLNDVGEQRRNIASKVREFEGKIEKQVINIL